MGKTRVCGATCHNARGAKCKCWCGGLFHGAGGEQARAEFATRFAVEKLPTTESAFKQLTGQPDLFSEGLAAGDEWRARLDAARDRSVTP